MKSKYKLSLILFTYLTGFTSLAQISPPGLGEANDADWFAVGLRQNLDSSGKWSSVSYIGLGRKSNPDNFDPLFKPAILVFNQEFYHRFAKNWQYSAALSYRRQDEYEKSAPFEHETPSIRQEFRTYGRLIHTHPLKRMRLTSTLREEFRKYFNPDFSLASEDFQLRTRARFQVAYNLTESGTHRVMLGSEQLFGTSRKSHQPEWTRWKYSESRFSLYYSYSPGHHCTISLGYMNNLIGTEHPVDVHYLAADVVFNNLFH